MTPRQFFLFGLLSVFLFAGSVAGTTSASPSPSLTPIEDPPTLVEHLRNELRAPEARQRELALVDIISLANCRASCTLSLHSIQKKKLRIENETGAGTAVALNELVPDLLYIYRRDPIDGQKLLALSALINIGNEKALESLIEKPARSSAQVAKRTQGSVGAFFLEKYPELLKRTERSGRLSLVDVEKARAVRVKQGEIAAQRN